MLFLGIDYSVFRARRRTNNYPSSRTTLLSLVPMYPPSPLSTSRKARCWSYAAAFHVLRKGTRRSAPFGLADVTPARLCPWRQRRQRRRGGGVLTLHIPLCWRDLFLSVARDEGKSRNQKKAKRKKIKRNLCYLSPSTPVPVGC